MNKRKMHMNKRKMHMKKRKMHMNKRKMHMKKRKMPNVIEILREREEMCEMTDRCERQRKSSS